MMKKIVVIFKSKYGATEKYARWIAEELLAEVFCVDKLSKAIMEDYDIIIYCGGLYVGGILGFSFIKNNYQKISSKKIIVIAVGATQNRESALEEVKKRNIPKWMNGEVNFFLLRGGLNYKKMSLWDRLLMYLLVKSLKRKKETELDADGKGLIATYGKEVDFTDKNSIMPVLDLVREL